MSSAALRTADETVDVSVIIPCHNEELSIGDQLDALEVQEYNGTFEVIVVDNRSTDGTAELVQRRMAHWPALRMVSAGDRSGAGYARNSGAAVARGKYLMFCDGDDVVMAGWVQAMSDGLDHNGLVAARIEIENLNPAWLIKSRGLSAQQSGPPRFYGGIAYAPAGAHGIHRSVFDSVGAYNEDIFGAEDLEYALRALQHGVDVTVAEDAIIQYRYRSTPNALYRQGLNYGTYRPLVAKWMVEAGLKRPPRLAGWKSWIVLWLSLPTIITAHGRARWAWIAGNRFGHLRGSIRYRTLLV